MLFRGFCAALTLACCLSEGALASGRHNLGSRARRQQERAHEVAREATREKRATNETTPAPRFASAATKSQCKRTSLYDALLILF